MFKKATCLLICIITLLACGSFASAIDLSSYKSDEPAQPKPVVVTVYVNNAKSTYDDEITQKLTERFNAKLTAFELRPGDKYVEKLNKIGVTDITTAERADIVGAFAGDNIDYVVYAEVQPPILNSWQSFFNIGIKATVTIPVKIIDLKSNKYLYNGKFTAQADNSAVIGGVGTKAAVMKAMDLVFVQTDDILTTRMPKN